MYRAYTVVKRNSKGRGVYADRDFRKGQIVEEAHVVVVPLKEIGKDSVLSFYVYYWTQRTVAVVLGNGFLYNHSTTPNVDFERCMHEKVMRFCATKTIRKGEELTISYVIDPSKTPAYLMPPTLAKKVHG